MATVPVVLVSIVTLLDLLIDNSIATVGSGCRCRCRRRSRNIHAECSINAIVTTNIVAQIDTLTGIAENACGVDTTANQSNSSAVKHGGRSRCRCGCGSSCVGGGGRCRGCCIIASGSKRSSASKDAELTLAGENTHLYLQRWVIEIARHIDAVLCRAADIALGIASEIVLDLAGRTPCASCLECAAVRCNRSLYFAAGDAKVPFKCAATSVFRRAAISIICGADSGNAVVFGTGVEIITIALGTAHGAAELQSLLRAKVFVAILTDTVSRSEEECSRVAVTHCGSAAAVDCHREGEVFLEVCFHSADSPIAVAVCGGVRDVEEWYDIIGSVAIGSAAGGPVRVH